MQPGWSLDLTRADPATGKAWVLSKLQVQSRVTKLLRETKPLFLIGSPPCTAFSSLPHLSRAKRDPAVVKAELDAARDHLNFCMDFYEIQIKGGKCFVDDHPHGAASWMEECLVRLAAMDGVGVA